MSSRREPRRRLHVERRRPVRPRRAPRRDPAGDHRGRRRRRCAISPASRSPPSAAAARARASSASTSSGSAARSGSPRVPSLREGSDEEGELDRDGVRRFEAHLRRELERGLIERTGKLPPSRPLHELDRALPTSPTQDLAAVHRSVTQLKRRLATLGNEQRGRRHGRHVDVRRTLRASLETGGVPLRLRYRPKRPEAPGDLRALRRLDLGHLGERLLPQRPARAARLVPQAAQLRLHRADQRDHRGLRARARLPQDQRADQPRRRRRRRLRLHRLRAGLARVPRGDLLRPRSALDGDRARRRAHQRPRPAPRGVRPSLRAGRADLLAQPRAAPLLELRRLGDGRLRAAHDGVLRVLDDQAPRAVRRRDRRRPDPQLR